MRFVSDHKEGASRKVNLNEAKMIKTGIVAAVLLFVAADFASAQSVTYTTRANAGRTRVSIHQRHMSAQKTRLKTRSRQQRRLKSRLLAERRDAMQRAKGVTRGRRIGMQADRALRERNKARQVSAGRKGTFQFQQQARTVQQQRSLKRRQANRRPKTPAPRTLAW